MTHQEVLDEAKAAMGALVEEQREVNREISQIEGKPEAERTPGDRARLPDLRAKLSGLIDAHRRIGVVTIEKLDKTEDVRQLVEDVKRVREALEAKHARLIKLGQDAKAAGEALEKAANIVAELEDLATQAGKKDKKK
jgi:hypothetical protein